MTAEDLRGSRRIVLDEISTKKECKMFMEIAKYFAILGDGYEGRISPHTTMEKFEGITLSRVAFLTYCKMLQSKYLKIFLYVTEQARKLVQLHFKIEKELYFSFTHLVCRSALPDSPYARTDFSHKIHADNCIIMKNMTCIRDFPAFTWREYSAILYLNDEFEGGEFIFTSDPFGENVESTVYPKCGRLVAFSSGPENLHGVKAVKKGTRCAIGMWFTYDEEYSDNDRAFGQYILDNNLEHSVDIPEDYLSRLAYTRWFLDKQGVDNTFVGKVLFTDEAGFTRDGFINSHNLHLWADDNPHGTIQTKNQLGFCVNVWVQIVGNNLVGPYFFDINLNGQRYLEFPQNYFPPMLCDIPLNIRTYMWFMRDGATLHFLNHLNYIFYNKWIDRRGPFEWPPLSPKLNTVDSLFWRYLKSLLYATPGTE